MPDGEVDPLPGGAASALADRLKPLGRAPAISLRFQYKTADSNKYYASATWLHSPAKLLNFPLTSILVRTAAASMPARPEIKEGFYA